MPEAWMIGGGVLVGVAIGLCAYRALGRRAEDGAGDIDFADEREERLTRRLAGQVRCDLPAALPFVRRELELGPSQPDDTIIKRAAYHYTRSLPEPGPCRVYRDRAPG
jgi:hypothetical protein